MGYEPPASNVDDPVEPWPRSRSIATALTVFGIAAHAWVCFFVAEIDLTSANLVFLVWTCAPYLVACAWLIWADRPAVAAGWCVPVLALNAFACYHTFVIPVDRAGNLFFLFAPAWNLLLLGPLGAFVVWPFAKKYNR